MKGYLTLFLIILMALLLWVISGSISTTHPIFAQEGGESGGSGESNESNDRGGTGDHCTIDRGRDDGNEGNEGPCIPDPNPPCTDYLGPLPPELAFFEPGARIACQAGETETGYTYKLCRDTCDNHLWLQNHGPVCTASVTPPVTTPVTTPAPPEPPSTPNHPYICEEINPPPGSVGKQLQLKYLKCGLR